MLVSMCQPSGGECWPWLAVRLVYSTNSLWFSSITTCAYPNKVCLKPGVGNESDLRRRHQLWLWA